MDTAIRDAEVKAYWEGLGESELNHDQKIDKVKKDISYHMKA